MVEKSDLERLRQYTMNTKWLLENIASLRANLPDRYVAICDAGKKVLDAPTREDLLSKLEMSGNDAQSCVIDFVSREEYTLIV